MSYLSRRDIDEMRPDLDQLISRVLGSADSSVLSTVEHCLYSGYDRRKTADKLASLLDNKKASRLSDKLENLLDDFKASIKAKKRSHDDHERGDSKRSKSSRNDQRSDSVRPEKNNKDTNFNTEQPADDKKDISKLSSTQIKQMMLNAQREIEERKRALTSLKSKESDGISTPAEPVIPSGVPQFEPPQVPVMTATMTDLEREKKRADLHAQIRAKLSGTLSNLLPQPVITDKPKPLILDAEGRTVDKTGREINIPTLEPTLKANIRAMKRDVFNKAQVVDRHQEEANEPKFYDDRIGVKAAVRTKRALRFHEPGKFQQMAERMRMKAQLEKLQNEISQIARKTGISSATKLALIAPKTDSKSAEVPQMEWWDSVILTQDLNTMKGDKISIREQAITNLIEHPTQMKPPSEFDILRYFKILSYLLFVTSSNALI